AAAWAVSAVLRCVLRAAHRLVDMANDDVGSAVVVQIAKGGAAANVLGLKERAGLRRDILKTNLERFVARLAQVAQQHWPLQQFRRRNRKAYHMAVGNEQVQGAIEIVVDEVGAEADIIEADGGNARPAAGIDKLGRGEFPRP